MFAKITTITILAAAFVSIQALPQSGEHSCNTECFAAASAYGLPPQECSADDTTCLGCGAPGFVKAMEECLQQSCQETVTLTCDTTAVRRQFTLPIPSVAGVGILPITIPTSFSASTTITGIQGPIGLGPSGVIVGSSTVPLTSIASHATSTSDSSPKGTGTATASGSSNTASSGNNNDGGSSSGAIGVSAPFSAVVAVAGMLAGASFVL
ncbi:hypothetical protein BDY19DRAFT_992260 [Irpex rosettiformis]|uniref:Uncharacterized protein n=1 Tax=Irpex rosettiformis TaxID=378272 RepID=A0ACB8U8Z3_9APHY|nr:hypothetical protein BDY19DRAFT_992260 [Irpex rosettiformis]